MQQAILEHVNITVSEPERMAALMCELFDWQIRWQGPAKPGGHTVHVGDYEPGRRFYFHDHDDIEYEVVAYI